MKSLSDLSLSGLYLCGHSAGAHLAAMVLSTDWSEYGVTPQIKGEVEVEDYQYQEKTRLKRHAA